MGGRLWDGLGDSIRGLVEEKEKWNKIETKGSGQNFKI